MDYNVHLHYVAVTYINVGRNSSVGTATRYGLDGLGIEFRWRRDFPHPSRQALGPTQTPRTMSTKSLPGGVSCR